MFALADGPTLGFWTWFLIGTPLTLGHLIYTVAICVLAFLNRRLRPLGALVGFVGVALLLLWPIGVTHMLAYSLGLRMPDSPPAAIPSP